MVILSWFEWGCRCVKNQIVVLMFVSVLFRVWLSAFLHSSWPFLLWQADNKTALHYANLSYGDSPHMGDDQHLRALRFMPHTASNTKKNPHTRVHLHTSDEGHREAEGKCLDVLRHLLGPSGRWWANQAACCLCHSPPPCTTPLPASWCTWQLASWTWNNVACERKAHERPPQKNTAGNITGQKYRVKSNLAP